MYQKRLHIKWLESTTKPDAACHKYTRQMRATQTWRDLRLRVIGNHRALEMLRLCRLTLYCCEDFGVSELSATHCRQLNKSESELTSEEREQICLESSIEKHKVNQPFISDKGGHTVNFLSNRDESKDLILVQVELMENATQRKGSR
jgi:hypothetical protein